MRMAWMYCDGCDCPLNYPTPEQVMDGRVDCPACGQRNAPRVTPGELMQAMHDEIQELKAAVAALAGE